MQISRGKLTRPRKCLVYGPQGIGKTTLAKDSLLLDIEGGSGDQDLARIDLSGVDYDGFLTVLGELMEEGFDEPTLAIDTLDWLEKLVKAGIKKRFTETELAYGQAKVKLEDTWEYLRRGFEKLMTEKGKNLLFLAHHKLEKVSPSDAASYQQFTPDLECDLIPEWCDDILFYRYRLITTEAKEGFGKVRQVAVPSRLRFFQTTQTPGAVAKNRLNLPDEIESFDEYRAFLAK